MTKIINWISTKIRQAYDWLVARIDEIGRDRLYCFIIGLVLAAFFAITLEVEWALWPVMILAFFKQFVNVWRSKGFDVYNFVATCLGGAVIWVFQLIG